MANTTDALYWAHLYQKAEEAQNRKEALALIHEAERLRNQERPLAEILRDSGC